MHHYLILTSQCNILFSEHEAIVINEFSTRKEHLNITFGQYITIFHFFI